MRILVLSDCHGDTSAAMAAIEAQPSATTILFLGDGIRDIERLAEGYSHKQFYTVRGNCDLASMEPATRLLELEGKRIMMTHGHEYKVKFGLQEVLHTAHRNGCDLLLYGHTHTPYVNYENGLHIMNPGSVARRNTYSYGIADLTPGGILCNIIYL